MSRVNFSSIYKEIFALIETAFLKEKYHIYTDARVQHAS